MSKIPTDKKVLRTTKKGTTYWYYPEVAERARLKRIERVEERKIGHISHNQSGEWNTIPTSVNVIKLDSTKDEHYLRYAERKKELREEYGRWSRMKRNQWLEYYRRLTDLLFHDEDFQHYVKVSLKRLGEKELDEKYEKMKQKDAEYDGSGDY